MLSNKQIHQIKKEYPKKPVEQIARELHVSESKIYKALGLKKELWTFRLETTIGYLVIVLLLIAPLVFMRGLHDFADLPQRVFIQCSAAVLVLLCSARIIITGEFTFPRSPLYSLIAVFTAWSFITLFWTNSIFEGFYAAVHTAACGAVFFSLTNLPWGMKLINRMLSAIMTAGVAVAAIGLTQHFFELTWVPMSVSPGATFGNPNMAADYLSMVLPLMLAMSFMEKALKRYAGLLGVLLAALFLWYSRSRGAWLAAACAVLYMAFLYVAGNHTIIMRRMWTGVVIVLTCCIIILSVFTSLRNSIVDAALSEYRLIAWRNCIEMIKDKPLQGVGAGNFKIFYPAYSHKAVPDRAFDTTKALGKAHNDYLQTAVELGVAGMLLFMLLPISGLIMVYRIISSAKRYPAGFMAMGIAGGLVSFMAGSFFSFYMERANPPLLLLTYLGIVTMLYSKYFPEKNMAKIRVPNTVSIVFIFCLLIAGVSLACFNFNNSMCEKYYFIAMGMEKQGSHRSALSAGQEAHSYNKYRMDVLTTVGRAYAATGETKKAVAALEKVIHSHPFDLNALFILGIAYANNDMNEKALAVFRTVLELNPASPEAKKIVCLLKSRKTVRISLT